MRGMESLHPGSLSISKELASSTILITGASGYVGSIVLEHVLRTSIPAQVYVVMRTKRGMGEPAGKISSMQSTCWQSSKHRTCPMTWVQTANDGIHTVIEGDVILTRMLYAQFSSRMLLHQLRVWLIKTPRDG